MRRVSKKQAKRNAEAKPFRDRLKAEVGRCECCGHDPARVRFGCIGWRLDVHEISRGNNRYKALDRPYAVLVVCLPCHDALGSAKKWPESRQLAVLKRSRPEDYDLAEYNALVGLDPDRITEEEVEQWTRS